MSRITLIISVFALTILANGFCRSADPPDLNLVGPGPSDPPPGRLAENYQKDERRMAQLVQAEVPNAVKKALALMATDPDAARHDLVRTLQEVRNTPSLAADVRKQLNDMINAALHEAASLQIEAERARQLRLEKAAAAQDRLLPEMKTEQSRKVNLDDLVGKTVEITRIKFDSESTHKYKIISITTQQGGIKTLKALLSPEYAGATNTPALFGASAISELRCPSLGLVLELDPSTKLLTLPSTANEGKQKVAADNAFKDLVGAKPGGTRRISYPIKYNGLFVSGTADFVFVVSVEKLNDDKTKALAKLTDIEWYWQGQPRPNIKSMPFKDPRGYKNYEAPASWGTSVKIGDTAWIDVTELKNGESDEGKTSETGKLETNVALGEVAAVAVSKVAQKHEESKEALANKTFAVGDKVKNPTFLVLWTGTIVAIDGDHYQIRMDYVANLSGKSPYFEKHTYDFIRGEFK